MNDAGVSHVFVLVAVHHKDNLQNFLTELCSGGLIDIPFNSSRRHETVGMIHYNISVVIP